MGGPNVPAAEKSSTVLQNYARYLPQILNATSAQQPNLAQNQLAATQATQPGYNALNLQQLQQFGLPTAQAGQAVTNSNALAGAQTNLNQIQGPGGQAAMAAASLARQANPNYYNTQDAASAKSQELLKSINLNGLSPGEFNATERATNQGNTQTGNLGLGNNTNTISNAMNFGGAFNAKQGLMNNAINTANQTATFNPVNIALGQPNASTMGNFGTGTFSNTNAGTQNQSGSNAMQFGSSMLGGMQGSNNAAIGANASLASAYTPSALLGSMPSYS